MNTTVTFELPEDVVAAANLQREKLSDATLQLFVLELYREERISLGRASEICKMTVSEFMDFSARRQVPLHYHESDLLADRKTLGKLL
jgi:predicted HTH domain antitoxin